MELYKNAPKKFEFTDGMNILFSGNGAGKSVALKFLKAYCSIQVAGWTALVDPKVLAPDPFPHSYRAFTPDKDRVVVDWDGQPVFYNSGDIADSNAWFYQKDGASEDGLSTEQERFDTMVEKPSSGQYRLKKINKMLNIIGNPPELEPNPMFGDVTEQLDYLNSLPKGGKLTILLDEPERSLSLPKQKKLLDVLMGFADKYQVIMACHSPFALNLPRDKVNFIEIEPNYIAECDKLFNF
jgi:hypothetical protein